MARRASLSTGLAVPARPCERAWDSLDPAQPPRLDWCRGVPGRRVVMLLGAFDPPTRAHLSLARSAARVEDAPAAFCLTKVLLSRPADELLEAPERLHLLDELATVNRFGLAVANRGTYLEVSRALRAGSKECTFVIGSDKLAQLADPSFYPDGERGVEATFDEVEFLVVPRPGAKVDRLDVRVLDPAEVFEDPEEMTISSTEVRRRIRNGDSVHALVPPEVAVGLGGYTAAR